MADKGEKYYPTGYASIGYMEVASADYGSGKQTTNYNYQSRPGGQSSYSQTFTAVKDCDKQTGNYGRATNTQAFSTGDTFNERSTGRFGYKDEFKTTSTYKVGDKSGSTEHQVSERVRNVTYGGSSYSNEGNNNNKYLQ